MTHNINKLSSHKIWVSNKIWSTEKLNIQNALSISDWLTEQVGLKKKKSSQFSINSKQSYKQPELIKYKTQQIKDISSYYAKETIKNKTKHSSKHNFLLKSNV